ncbi:hypothetical protein BAL199_01279 [alpha proteobacterium BAL199]|jgi:ketosteroid isomerase-like protein|nr:hypothetical protein BAL199_01279 [alpha proteobacterium BAL199]
MMIRPVIAAAALVAASYLSTPVHAAPADEVTALYEQFVAAQNRHDLTTVRALLVPTDAFVWVSDGKAFWGPETMIERMSRFQASEVWEVIPDRERRRFIDLSADSAYLYQPLTLRIGSAAQPDAIPFLVSVLCVQTEDGWRIKALLTTVEKP